MRSWIPLLLLAALLTARLRFGNAEGDPLPPSLVDLVRNSPIASVEDLKLLLQQETDAIEDEEDWHDLLPKAPHGRYVRSLEAQPAQQAICKVRTEVMEITRSMLDRRNANFLLWPPCVEVQRCSGCCNNKVQQCVPTVTSSRYLQVIKIQYINRKPHYEKAIISVEDHVSCRCQVSTSSSSPSTISIPRSSNPDPPPPQQPPPASSHLPHPKPAHPSPPKTQTSKADLHRHDDLKHNQQFYHSEERDPVARQWQHGSYTQLVRWTQPRVTVPQTPTLGQIVHQPVTGLLRPVHSWPSEARAEHSVMESVQPLGHGSGYDGSREESTVHVKTSSGEQHHPDHGQRQQQLLQHQQRQHHQPHHAHQLNYGGADDRELRTQYRLNAPQSDSALPPVTPTHLPQLTQNPTSPTYAVQTDSVTSQKYIEVTNPKQTVTGIQREDIGSANSGDPTGREPANPVQEKDSKLHNEDGHLSEEERRLKLLEMIQRESDSPSLPKLHHPLQRPKPTTFKTALSSVAPKSPLARQAPFRPASPRRRRKHRKRISKATMRAMIM